MRSLGILVAAAILVSACGGGGGGGSSIVGGGGGPGPQGGLSVAGGLTISVIANVSGARELVGLPNGDLLVGTEGNTIALVPGAESAGSAGTPHTFATINDNPDAGVAYSPSKGLLIFGTQHGVYTVAYTSGDQTASAAPTKIANLRLVQTREDHVTTSVATTAATIYASIGSSSNNTWPEEESTRATIQQLSTSGGAMSAVSVQTRNAIAVTISPSGALWAGDAGQDELATGQPYEFFDAVTLQSGSPVNYGWPFCYDNQLNDNEAGAPPNCNNVAIPRVIFPAYSTVIGATFYPTSGSGTYALPALYRGGAFVTMHGSWHQPNGCNVKPLVAFVPMSGDAPQTPANWNDPTAQWQTFVSGFQPGCDASTRIGRPTGIAVGSQGSLFVADDQTGNIYRIR